MHGVEEILPIKLEILECHSGWDGMENGHATPNPQWDGSKYIYPIPIPKSRRDGGGISHNSQRTDHLPN